MWLEYSKEQQKNLITQTAVRMNLPDYAVEKDAWICLILRIIFNSKYASQIIFKGGTSLSKAYKIINRFSEDIDLIIDKEILGFKELKSKSDIKRLRRASGNFVINEFRNELINQLNIIGVSSNLYEIKYNPKVGDTSDPNTLEFHYDPVIPYNNSYIRPRILIELGARSLIEPNENKVVTSFIDEIFPDLVNSEKSIVIKTVIPTRTFIEKVLLLHEEFLKSNIKSYRLTRHYYDIDKLMDTRYAQLAINDKALFDKIVHHRKTVTPLRNISYDLHNRQTLSIIPPIEVTTEWKKDYKEMQENMIIGESKSFKELLVRMEEVMKLFRES